MSNYVDFFRYNDKYEDVFIEDGDFLYASAEPYDRAYMLLCRKVIKIDNDYIVTDITSADVQYLANLEPAPDDAARDVIKAVTGEEPY